MPAHSAASPAPLVLRDYQERTIQAVRQPLAELPSVLATAPTGAGKTVMFSEIVRPARLHETTDASRTL